MRWTKFVFGALAALALAACGGGPAISNIEVKPAVISPNADGKEDLARIAYTVDQTVQLSIYLLDGAGKRYSLVDQETRAPRPVAYERLFNGIVDGKMLANGDYTVVFETKGAGAPISQRLPLKIVNADPSPPKILDFTVAPTVITPNRDGVGDRAYINVVTSKKARLGVYVTGPNGFRQDVPRREGYVLLPSSDGESAPGRYTYEYDGGIDLGADPPPAGRYVLNVELQDAIGQRDILTASLTLSDSGRPQAEIAVQPNGEGVEWSRRGPQTVLALGDTLYFTTTVRNTGLVPIRTGGPFDPADCYTMDQNRFSKGFSQESGAFRIGIDFESNTGMDHPWRWGVGALADLRAVDYEGGKLYYLDPGKQVVVRGCVKLTRIPVRNPFYVWASLIQEDVEIATINNRVSPLLITLVKP